MSTNPAISDAVLGLPLVIVPGWGGSGPEHWQSRWQESHPRATRFEPSSVDFPDPHDWLDALGRAVGTQDEPPVLVAHSLGTLTAAAWMARNPGGARAALLVAPPDVRREGAPGPVQPFAVLTADDVVAPTHVVASTNDPYGSVGFARTFAQRLGAPITTVGAAGHINADSGLGAWPDGLALLDALVRGAATT